MKENNKGIRSEGELFLIYAIFRFRVFLELIVFFEQIPNTTNLYRRINDFPPEIEKVIDTVKPNQFVFTKSDIYKIAQTFINNLENYDQPPPIA